MNISLDSRYFAIPDDTILGYVGETNARSITFENFTVAGATNYKIQFDFADGVSYVGDIVTTTGVFKITGSVNRIAGEVKCQVLATAGSGTTYTIVKKSNVFVLKIREALRNQPAPIPTYEQAKSYADQVIAAKDSCNTAVTQATSAATQASASATSATSSMANLAALPPNILPIAPELWEQGVINSTTGVANESAVRIRTRTYIAVTPSTNYTLTKFLNGQICIYEYTSDETFVKMSTWYSGNAVITTQPTTEKIKVVLLKNTSTENTTVSDLMSYYKWSICKRSNAAPYWQYPVMEDIQAFTMSQLTALTLAVISLGGNI